MSGGLPQAAAALARIRIVLVRTRHPGNIGAAARAMKTMGLRELWLVSPERFPDREATTRAAGASDLLDAAHVCSTLDEALAGTTFALALTARRRDIGPPPVDPRESGRLAFAQAASGGEVAIVFGNEVYGLENADVLKCHRVAHIPTDPDFSSLNLGAAVQVVAYETRMAALDGEAGAEAGPAAATHEEVERFYSHLEASLLASGFLMPAHPKRLIERLRRLFGRARLEHEEVSILRGMLTAWDAPHPPQKPTEGG